MTLGCFLRKAGGDGIVPYALLMEAPEFLLGLKLRDVAGRLGLPKHAGAIVDGVLDDLFAAIPAGRIPAAIDAALTNLSTDGSSYVRNDETFGAALPEGEVTAALNAALRNLTGEGGPVYVRSDERFELPWWSAMFKLVGKSESLKEEFRQAEKLCHVPIAEYLGGQAVVRFQDGTIRSVPDVRDLSELTNLVAS